jgi:hypothetical protein
MVTEDSCIEVNVFDNRKNEELGFVKFYGTLSDFSAGSNQSRTLLYLFALTNLGSLTRNLALAPGETAGSNGKVKGEISTISSRPKSLSVVTAGGLPSGWEERLDCLGSKYFVDYNSETVKIYRIRNK